MFCFARARILPLLLSCCLVLSTAWAPAADSVRENSALKLAPADAAFFQSSLRLRQQLEAVLQSKAFSKLLKLPALLKLTQQAQDYLKDQAANEGWQEALKLLSDPDNIELLSLIADASSHEIFIYGDDQWGDLFSAFNEINDATSAAQLDAIKNGGAPNPEEQTRAILDAVSKQLDNLNAPTLVLGFKLTDQKSAPKQLARAEKALLELLKDIPQLKDRLSREKIGAADALTLQLDGSQIPWDKIPDTIPAALKEQFEKLKTKLKPKTIAITLALLDDYLIISLAESNEHLKTLGQGKLLADLPELAPVLKAGDKPLTSITYVSQDFVSEVNSADQQIDNMVKAFERLIPLAPVAEALQKEMLSDLKTLGADIKQSLPEPHAMTALSYQTPRGYESFAYNWGGGEALESSKPLTLTQHLGGNPLLFAVGRHKPSTEEYEKTAAWLKRIVYYIEEIALPQVEAEHREGYQKFKKEFAPIVTRFNQATRDLFSPALADGQDGFVFDAKLAKNKWHEAMAASKKPLPIPELALTFSVSDAALLRKAINEYYAIAQLTIDKIHLLAPDQIPEVKIPAPKSREVAGGDLFYYELPAAAGLDGEIAPAAGIGQDVWVLALTKDQVKRMLKPAPYVGEGPLAKLDRPLAGASAVNFAALIDAIAPWVEYGFDQAAEENQDDAKEIEEVRPQVAVALNFLKCFRGVSSATYRQGPDAITHAEWRFADQP